MRSSLELIRGDMEDEAMEDVAPTSILTFNLLLLIKRAQAQHGLRHGDYTRYRCRHRPRNHHPPSGGGRCGSAGAVSRRVVARQTCSRCSQLAQTTSPVTATPSNGGGA